MDEKHNKLTESKGPKRPQFQWKKWRKTETPAPSKRCGHVATADEETNDVKLYVCSGTADPLYPPSDNELIPDIWSYSLRTESWTQVPIQSAPAIGYAAAVQIDHKILLFGGWNRNPVNSALVFDCQKADGWKILATKKPPAARHTHTLTLCKTMIYLFGGTDRFGKRFGDLHELDPITCEWEEIRAPNGPVPRSQHSAVACDQFLYIFGGRDGMDRVLSDFWCFDTVNQKWRQLESPVSPLWYIEGTRLTGPFTIEDRKYLVLLHGYSFENIFLYDIREGKWQPHRCVGDIPSNRGYFSATLMTRNEAIIFGGQDDNGTLNDLYSLYLYDGEAIPLTTATTTTPTPPPTTPMTTTTLMTTSGLRPGPGLGTRPGLGPVSTVTIISAPQTTTTLQTSSIKRTEPPRRSDPLPSSISENSPQWVRELFVNIADKFDSDFRTVQSNMMNLINSELERVKRELQHSMRENLGLVSPLRDRPREEQNISTLIDTVKSLIAEVKSLKQAILKKPEATQLLKISYQLHKLSQDTASTPSTSAPIKASDLLRSLHTFLKSVVNTKGRELTAVEKQQLRRQLEQFPQCYSNIQFDSNRPEEEQVIVMILELLNLSRKRTQFPDPTLMPLFLDLLNAVEAILGKGSQQD